MNLISIFNQFPDQAACIAHLEQIRWSNDPFCPLCGDHDVARKAENHRVGRWNCHGCQSSFNVLSKTIFQGTKIPLQKWFLAISLMANAKKSLSSCQLARDLELNQKSAWFMQQRIRAAMASDEGALLQGIIEADEAYLGPRTRRKGDQSNRRGRGSGKTPVVGAVQRKGDVRAAVTDDTKGATVLGFIEQSVEVSESSLITDEYTAYVNAHKLMPHRTVNHSANEYVDADDRPCTPTPSKGSGRGSSALGTAPITSTRKAGRRCSWPKPFGSTTTARTPTPSTVSSGRVSPSLSLQLRNQPLHRPVAFQRITGPAQPLQVVGGVCAAFGAR